LSDQRFVHLHCHSHFSLLDGAGAIDKLVNRAAEYGMNGLAITDHGNLHGALKFYQSCKRAQINPIIGYEAYIAPESRFNKSGTGQKENSYHLTLLCQNRIGFQNLIKMASHASLEGFYFKPRIDKELLESHSEGIICLSGCVSSELNRYLLRGNSSTASEHFQEATRVAQWFHNIFGDRYFIEIMNNGVDIQKIALQGCVEISKRVGIPLVATSDCHYVDKDDAEAQDIMLCINTGRFRTDRDRMRMDGSQYFLRSPQEMYEKFRGLEEAVSRSQEIADSVDIELELGKRHFPVFEMVSDENEKPKSADDYLRELCIAGLKERYAHRADRFNGQTGELSDVVMQRLDRELDVITRLGFSNYFLIVWDFVDYARKQDIPATARGSGVGAIVCYALYLSHVCPIEYDLLFERFLDENRLEAPDIDIDFCKERRSLVIKYVKEKYGEASVAQIGTFGTLAARQAIKDVGRALGMPLGRVNEITAMVPDHLGISLEKALKSEELKQAYENDGQVKELLDLARKIEGLARNVGTHAAAVVIGDKPLTEYVPLGRVTGKDDIITQWSMEDVEAAGLLKMDFLGLRNLTILSAAVTIIEQTRGERIDPHKFPLDDKETFALLQRGETKGIFQLESGGIRDLLQRMKPDHFRDIIATNALYRPGPLEGGMVDQYIDVKTGRRNATYQHDVLEEILKETHGVMVYQEQVMRILNRLGSIPLAKAYTCIKAISKKKEKTIAENHEAFIEGSTEKGLSKKDAQELWEMILKFAGYGFNKSHSTAYALIAYQTAYLKSHYPVEFMAALLTGDIPGRNFTRKDSLVEHLEDCQRMGIEVEAANVNESGVLFTVNDNKIYFALSAIKGCGGAAAEAIVRNRADSGPFKDIFDFCERIETSTCSRSSMEALIKAGAMDCFGANRSQLMSVLDRAIQSGLSALADLRSGQMNLFGGDDSENSDNEKNTSLPDLPEWEEREKLANEKEVLGFYLSSHPLAEYEEQLKNFVSATTSQTGPLTHRQEVVMGGMISSIKYSHVKKVQDAGSPTKYAMFDLEDVEGAIRCIQWPREFAKCGELIQPDAVVLIQGSIDKRGGDEANLIVNEVIPLDQIDHRYTKTVRVQLDQVQHNEETVKEIFEIIQGYEGSTKFELLIRTDDQHTVLIESQKLKVGPNDEMRSRVEQILGPGSLQYITEIPKPENTGRKQRWQKVS
jgi:DNA polymerase III subunit alpha